MEKSSQKDFGLPPELITTDVRLTAIIRGLEHYYGGADEEARSAMQLIKEQIIYLSTQLPHGISHLTFESKGGIFGLSDSLEGLVDDKAPVPTLVFKWFQRPKDAFFVNGLTNFIRENNNPSGPGIYYLQTPRVYWPLEITDGSVIFIDVVAGSTVAGIVPRLRKFTGHEQYGKEARRVISDVKLITIDDLVHWQQISQKFAQEHGISMDPSQARSFPVRALMESAQLLEEVTERKLSADEKSQLEEAATYFADKISANYSFEHDMGPLNIMIAHEHQEISKILDEFRRVPKPNSDIDPVNKRTHSIDAVSEAMMHVDIPFELRTAHQLRDLVRFAYHPSINHQNDAVDLFSLYLYRQAYFAMVKEHKQDNDLYVQMRHLHDRITGSPPFQSILPPHFRLVGNYLHDNPYDLPVAVISEAARMNVVIPSIFMRNYLQLKHGTSNAGLEVNADRQLARLMEENTYWADLGSKHADYLRLSYHGEASKHALSVMNLFSEWCNASANKRIDFQKILLR